MNLRILKKLGTKIIKIENLEENIQVDLSKVNLSVEDIGKLEEFTLNFFPNHGSWTSSAYNKSESSIYCHLRDENWLAKKRRSKKQE